FHLDRAATRLAATDWARLYPPLRARRARAATLGMLIIAVALVVAVPGRTRVRASGVFEVAGPAPGAAASLPMMQLIPPDLRKRLEELIAAAERGKMSNEQTKQAAELYNLFTALNEDIDTEKLKELAKAMDPTQQGSPQQAAKKMTELAGRTLKAADTK